MVILQHTAPPHTRNPWSL